MNLFGVWGIAIFAFLVEYRYFSNLAGEGVLENSSRWIRMWHLEKDLAETLITEVEVISICHYTYVKVLKVKS